MTRKPLIVALLTAWSLPVAAVRADAPGAWPSANAPMCTTTAETSEPAVGPTEDQQIVRRTPAEQPARRESAMVRETSILGRGFGALVIVLATIGLAAWALKRFAGKAGLRSSPGLKVLSRTYLSSKQSLVAVRLGKRVLIIGVTPEHVSHIATIDNAEEVADLVSGTRAQAGFDRLLETEQTHFHTDESEQDSADLTPDYRHLSVARSELKGVLTRVKRFKASARAG